MSIFVGTPGLSFISASGGGGSTEALYYNDTSGSTIEQVKTTGNFTEQWRTSFTDKTTNTGQELVAGGTDLVWQLNKTLFRFTNDGSTKKWEVFENDATRMERAGNYFYRFHGSGGLQKYDADGNNLKEITTITAPPFDGHSQDDLYWADGNGDVEKVDDSDTSQWTWTPPNGNPINQLIADPNGGIWVFTFDSGETITLKNVELVDPPEFTRSAGDTNFIPSVSLEPHGDPAITISSS